MQIHEAVDERALLRKIDLHVVPPICVLYLLAFLDRVNISNAVIFGLQEDLGLTGVQYNTALTIFFVPYILFELPSNMLLKRLRPHVWLSICMFGFGLVTMLQGFTQSYSGLLATRFFLGVFEAGMFPGAFYLLAMYYKRAESQKRYSFFFSSTSLAGAFGGLLASAIGKLDHFHGLRGWRWIFILEGLLTLAVSGAFFFLLADFPEDAAFLTPAERAAVKARLHADVGDPGTEARLTPRSVARVFRDPKILLGGLMYLGLIVPAYGFAYFAPTIIRSFTASTIRTQLLSVPPWAVAFCVSMLVATASDRAQHRFAFALVPIFVCAAGFATLLAVHDSPHTQYAALFLVASGAYSAMPVIVCWFNTNLAGHTRRAVGTAWQVGFGNVGGIVATYSFLKTDAPKYTKGYAISVGFVGLSALACVAYLLALLRENRRREKMAERGEVQEGVGDLDGSYRYLT
ncbi:major facilitator superfamily domain-containing protein [Geopyxis carbonaria]|nr:major facilitator superfamily domain-containing protein [Geopyxis carbonaria]